MPQARVGPIPGVYCLYEGDVPQYVGESENMQRRLKEHRGGDPSNADLVNKLMKMIHGYSKGNSKSLITDYPEDHEQCKARVAEMMVGYLLVQGDKDERLSTELHCKAALPVY